MKVLKTPSLNKENFSSRTPAYIAKEQLTKPVKLPTVDETCDELKHKKVELASTSSQTSPATKATVTEKDLTSTEPPSAAYFELLAEKRREALVEALEENEYLHEKVEALETELNHSKSMLQQSRELVEVLTEMLQEKENEANERAEGEQPASQYSHLSEAEEADEGQVEGQLSQRQIEEESTPLKESTEEEVGTAKSP